MRNLSRIDNILDNYEKKVKQYELNATDQDVANAQGIWLAAYKKLGDNSSRLILASVNDITEAQAKMVVPSLTDNEMTAYAPSFTVIQTEEKARLLGTANIHYASVIATRPPMQYVKYEARAEKCKALTAGLQYLDTELDCVWQKKDIDGKPYLYRKNDKDLEEILKATLLAKTDVVYRNQADNFIVTANAKQGDYVEFFAMQQEGDNLVPFMDVAKVTSNNGTSLGIEIEDGGYKQDATISAHAVKNVITAKEGTSRKDVLDYLIRAYGSQFADILKQTGSMTSPALGEGNQVSE